VLIRLTYKDVSELWADLGEKRGHRGLSRPRYTLRRPEGLPSLTASGRDWGALIGADYSTLSV